MENRLSTLITLFLCLVHFGCGRPKENDKVTTEMPKDEVPPPSTLGGLGLSISLPENWKSERDGNTFVFKEDCNQGFCTNLIVSSIDNKDELNLDQVAESFVASLDQKFKESKVLGITDKPINGFDFKLVDYKMHEQGTHLGGTTAFLIKDNKIISFNFMAENEPAGSYGEKRGGFEYILATVKP